MPKKSLKKPSPLVSIVILNWNGLEDTKLCLEHVRNLDYDNYEIIVVDNYSTRDESRSYLKKQKDITLILNESNTGFAGGHDDALPHCKGEFILLLNNDAVIKSDYLIEALPYFEKDPQLSAMGGRSYFWNEDARPLDEHNQFYSYQTINPYSGEAFMKSEDNGVIQSVNNLSGSAVVIRRSVIDEVGYLYRPFFLYFEETDLFARFKRAGYKTLYNPRLKIWHKNGASTGSSSGSQTFFYYIFRNRFIFAIRNFELHFLLHFFWLYGKMSLKSLLMVILKPHTANLMHRAYAKAALRNLFFLGHTLFLRYELRKKLGPSQYSQQLIMEQTGVSIVLDCRKVTASTLKRVISTIAADHNPLHEYLLLADESQAIPDRSDNIRVIVDRQYFTVHPINLACLAAQFDWMVISDAHNLPKVDQITPALLQAVKKKAEVIAYTVLQKRAPFVVVHKNFFEHIGGLGSFASLQQGFDYLIAYARAANGLLLTALEDNVMPSSLHPVPALTKAQQDSVAKRITYDKHLAKEAQPTKFSRILVKYYRLHQLYILTKWLFTLSIPWRLKLGRLKQLLYCILKIDLKGIAIEIKHMRNEVAIYVLHSSDREKKRLLEVQYDTLSKNKSYFDIPIFIICRDRLETLQQLVKWLEDHNMKKIIFIDNDSAYPPLLRYYEHTPYQVLLLLRNIGHTAPWTLGIIRCLVPEEFYLVSDPDVIPAKDCPNDVMQHLLQIHKKHEAYDKVGLSLKIDDLPDSYPLKHDVISWEKQFWKNSIDNKCFDAGVDTTFALYKPHTYRYTLHPSIRTNAPYSAHHLPWYSNPKNITEEEKFYRYRANSSISSWNTDALPERYQEELKKAK